MKFTTDTHLFKASLKALISLLGSISTSAITTTETGAPIVVSIAARGPSKRKPQGSLVIEASQHGSVYKEVLDATVAQPGELVISPTTLYNLHMPAKDTTMSLIGGGQTLKVQSGAAAKYQIPFQKPEHTPTGTSRADYQCDFDATLLTRAFRTVTTKPMLSEDPVCTFRQTGKEVTVAVDDNGIRLARVDFTVDDDKIADDASMEVTHWPKHLTSMVTTIGNGTDAVRLGVSENTMRVRCGSRMFITPKVIDSTPRIETVSQLHQGDPDATLVCDGNNLISSLKGSLSVAKLPSVGFEVDRRQSRLKLAVTEGASKYEGKVPLSVIEASKDWDGKFTLSGAVLLDCLEMAKKVRLTEVELRVYGTVIAIYSELKNVSTLQLMASESTEEDPEVLALLEFAE